MRVVFAVVFLCLATAVVSSAKPLSEDQYQAIFTKWMQQHSKQYEHDSFFYRYTVWKANMEKIDAVNSKNLTYSVAMNEFGDLTWSEFKASYMGYRHVSRDYIRSQNQPAPHPGYTVQVPDNWDWRDHNAVTPVKNQQQCGSCWSFSATGSLEGAYAIKNKNLVSFSEQELVDCSAEEGNAGCNGGWMDQAFEYVIKYGLATEDAYPYTAMDGTCKNASTARTIKPGQLTGYKDLPKDESQFLAAAAIGPLSIAIEADQSCFQFYSTGVMDSDQCGSTLDHGVLIVGWGTDAGQSYWNVKNSWGTTWGEAGYIRLSRNKNMCGLNQASSYPVFG